MFLSPPEIQHQKLKSRLGSYDRDQVDELLENVVASYEQVWRERDKSRDQVAELERELRDYQELERPLRDSLVTAQRAATEVKTEAAKQAEAILSDAKQKAEQIVLRAERERDTIKAEIARLEVVENDAAARCRAVLVDALEALGSSTAPALAAADSGRSRGDGAATRA
jgi:cell division initiation protein